MVLIKNNIQKINPNKHFISFKKSEDNKNQENKKVPSVSEIALGATAVVALGVATVAIISSYKNKKAYEKILDEKISKKIEEKSTEIIDTKVTQKINEKTDKMLDNKIIKVVENKTSEIVEKKFDREFDIRFKEYLSIYLNTFWEYLENDPKIKEFMENFGSELTKLGDWIENVNRKLGFIDTLSYKFNLRNLGINTFENWTKTFFPNFR